MSVPDFTPAPLNQRFEDALLYAAQLHAGQERKGSGIPYVAHLLSVAALVIEDGGSEDEAIAALLHDAVEDQGGAERLRAIAGRYGTRVARIVLACSDTTSEPKPPWPARKEAYLAHLPDQPSKALRVSMADKLHNARSIVADIRRHGDAVFERFTGKKEGTLWYYRSLVRIYSEAGCQGYLREELERVVAEMERLAQDAKVEAARATPPR